MKSRFLITAIFAALLSLGASAITGDVNGDNEVNISDVNAVIDVILNSGSSAAADVNHDGEVNISDVNAVIDIILGGGQEEEIVPKEIALDFSPLTEPAERIQEDEDAPDYGDYVENTSWTTTVKIDFNGETAAVTGNPSAVIVNIDGAHVTVTSAAKKVKYIVSGTTADGSLKFYSDKKFQVQLNGADITNPHGAAINNQCGKSFYLVSNAGTVNTLRDGSAYTMTEGEDQKGTVFSEGQILVSGKGTLNVYSTGKNCIASDDYILIRPGSNLYLNSTGGHGIKAKDWVHVKGGVINMEINADGAKGINCDSVVNITGGRTTIINTGSSKIEYNEATGVNDTTGCAGVKADYDMTMSGGVLNIKCTGNDAKGVNVTKTLAFKGGELNTVATGSKTYVTPKGVKCDTDVNISGGAFYSCAPHGKALDVDGTLTVNPGYSTCNDSDQRLTEIYY